MLPFPHLFLRKGGKFQVWDCAGAHIPLLYPDQSPEACYVNKTFVEKLGYTVPEVLTWDFIFEVSAAAMEKDEDGNFNGYNPEDDLPPVEMETGTIVVHAEGDSFPPKRITDESIVCLIKQ